MGIAILVPGANFTGKTSFTVTLSESLAIEALVINGPNYVRNEASYFAKLFPTFTTQRNFTWSIVSGGSYASISNDGKVSVNSTTTTEQSVVIRCESLSDPNVFDEKTITVIAQNIVEVNYLQSDGTAYFGLGATGDTLSCTVTLIGYASTSNGYLFGQRISAGSEWAKIAIYKQSSSGKIAAALGQAGYYATSILADNSVYKYIFTTSSGVGQSDGSFRVLDMSGNELQARTALTMTASGYRAIFGYGTGAVGGTPQVDNLTAGRFYGLKYEQNNTVIADFVPCTVNTVPAILDRVSGVLSFASGNPSGITYGY